MARQYPELYKKAIKVSMAWNQKMYMDGIRLVDNVEKRQREQKARMKNRKIAGRNQSRKTEKEKGMKRSRQRERSNEWRGKTR